MPACSPEFVDFPTALKLLKDTVKQYGNNFIRNGQLISKRLFGIFHSSKKWTKKFYLTTMQACLKVWKSGGASSKGQGQKSGGAQ